MLSKAQGFAFRGFYLFRFRRRQCIANASYQLRHELPIIKIGDKKMQFRPFVGEPLFSIRAQYRGGGIDLLDENLILAHKRHCFAVAIKCIAPEHFAEGNIARVANEKLKFYKNRERE